MYQLISLLTGIMLAIMIFINGRLTDAVGVFQATAVLHSVGVLFALLACLIRKEKPLPRSRSPWWFYTGGIIGIFTAYANNFAFGKISMTSIVALALLGQTVASLVIDATGWFGMVKRPIRKSTLIGLTFCLAGIFMMLDHTVLEAALAVWFSFGAGISIVISRSINARLAERIGALPGSFVNHLAGLPLTVLFAVLAAEKQSIWSGMTPTGFWIYLGGALGVLGVVLFNILVPKISQFHLTVLTFVGQVFAGIALDLAMGGFKVDASFIGGLVIAAGIGLNLAIEFAGARKKGAGSSGS